MGWFTAAQRLLSAGRSVFYGELCEADFTSGTGFYWDGFGDLVAYATTWTGVGILVARSDVPFGVDDEAGKLTLTLSGVDDDMVARVSAESPEFYNRGITLWGQFFDEALQPIEERFFLFGGTMDVPTYGGSGPGQRSIEIPCEGEWSDRNEAALSFFSDLDQQRRFPGDKGCEYVYRYHAGVRRTWPHF